METLVGHSIHHVTAFEIVGPYVLLIAFADGTQQTIDFKPLLRGDLFRPLQNRELFEQVRVDSESHTLVWPNGADMDPAILHDWPARVHDMTEMTARWQP